MKKILWFSFFLIATATPPANGEQPVSNDHEATLIEVAAKLGCAKILGASLNIGWAGGGGTVIEPPVTRHVPRVKWAAESLEGGVIQISVGAAPGAVRGAEGLSKAQINKRGNQLLEEWSRKNAVEVYPVETVDCFVAGLDRLQSKQETLVKSVVSRQDRAEAAMRQLNEETSIELRARIEELERRLAQMQKLVEASQTKL